MHWFERRKKTHKLLIIDTEFSLLDVDCFLIWHSREWCYAFIKILQENVSAIPLLLRRNWVWDNDFNIIRFQFHTINNNQRTQLKTHYYILADTRVKTTHLKLNAKTTMSTNRRKRLRIKQITNRAIKTTSFQVYLYQMI